MTLEEIKRHSPPAASELIAPIRHMILNVDLLDDVDHMIEHGESLQTVVRHMFDSLPSIQSRALGNYVRSNFEPPYYAFDRDMWLSKEEASGKVLVLPSVQKSFAAPEISVSATTKGNKLMSTIKETANKSKDQVIKTAIGQAGVAGIKSLILTALPMKIGFIGRMLGRHRQVANNSLVVAGIAILANQAGQKYISNEAVKNALQSTQDQALSEVLNEYIGIENQVTKVVSSALQLEQSPVTMDAQY